MILVLFLNGASVAPLFLPLVPQTLLVAFALRFGGLSRLGQVPWSAIAVSSLFFLLAVLAAWGSNGEQAARFLKLLGNSVVAFLVARALVRRYGERLPDAYLDAMVALSLAGLVGLLLSTVVDWHVTASIGDRTYQTNGLNVWISDAGFDSSATTFSPFPHRLQSFFDEPGTYGISSCRPCGRR